MVGDDTISRPLLVGEGAHNPTKPASSAGMEREAGRRDIFRYCVCSVVVNGGASKAAERSRVPSSPAAYSVKAMRTASGDGWETALDGVRPQASFRF